jgi:DNA-binding response OmpR family regulator
VNGMELCRELRRSRPGFPVVLISASYRAAEQETVWREAGAAAFLEQPIEASALLSAVRDLTR